MVTTVGDAQPATAQLARERVKAGKEPKQFYVQERIEDAAEQTAEIAERIVELRSILEQTLSVDDRIDFASFRVTKSVAPFDPPKKLRTATPPPLRADFLLTISPPTGLGKLVSGATKGYQQALEALERVRRSPSRAPASGNISST